MANDVAALIKEAFIEGFGASETYNDTLLNTPEEAWQKSDAIRDALALTSPVAPEQVAAIDRESLIDLIEDNLYAVYHCTRVWSAWGVGTMSEDDFHEARGTELAPDLADAIIAKFAASPEAEPAAMKVMDPKKLGEDVARWTGFEYTGHRTDNGQPEQRVNVSVERLGHAVAAVIAALPAATPAAPSAGVVEALRETVNQLRTIQMDPRDRWSNERTNRVSATLLQADRALAQPAPVQAGAQQAAPIDMVLHCPDCGEQHIDAPEPADADIDVDGSVISSSHAWDNPPHRSHKCHFCGHIWRPADVPTNGVQAVKTTGKADSPLAAPTQAGAGDAKGGA